MANITNSKVNGVSYTYDQESRSPLGLAAKMAMWEGTLVYDKNTKAIRSFFVRNTAQLSEAAALIYRSDLSCTKDEFSGAAAGLSEKGMTVNARLEWYFLDRHIFTFNPGNVENELLGNVFDLRR